MTNEEFDLVTYLSHVRTIRASIEILDPGVGDNIKDEEHATVRRIVRSWEQRLTDCVKIRKSREIKP
ncbi:MAG TPA: hypothetical protein VJQ59_16855 [Candidatus Sulfotelmatobacter sp.]|nr:hypothetical protein [Candidatus Sulfotelmatobacter sp.]